MKLRLSDWQSESSHYLTPSICKSKLLSVRDATDHKARSSIYSIKDRDDFCRRQTPVSRFIGKEAASDSHKACPKGVGVCRHSHTSWISNQQWCLHFNVKDLLTQADPYFQFSDSMTIVIKGYLGYNAIQWRLRSAWTCDGTNSQTIELHHSW